VNDLVQFYSYAVYMYWPAALTGKVALLSVLVAVAGGNERPGHKLLTATLAAHLLMSAFILFVGLIMVGMPFGNRLLRGPVGEPVAILALLVGATIALCLFAPGIKWQTRSEHRWAGPVFWTALAIAVFHPFFNDSVLGAILASPTAVLPHPTLMAGCALVWMTGREAHRITGFALVGGAFLLGLHDALIWGIGSSWLLVAYASAAAVVLLVPDFSIQLPSFSNMASKTGERSLRAPKEPRPSRKEEAPRWRLK
jgi:hypothetical protein